MNKKARLLLVSLFLFLFVFNYLSPLSMGDDYVYSFIWSGQPIYEPLPHTVKRVASLSDLCYSQWVHYFTWSGRTVSHTLAQFFLWLGKPYFNIANTVISILLVFELYWSIQKGKLSFNFNFSSLIGIFLLLWICTPGFGVIFFWLTGACNYLWTSVLLLGFFLVYIKKYYCADKILFKSFKVTPIMFLLGVLAGWTNENSVCWVVIMLLCFIIMCKKQELLERWMISGWVGLVLGYIMLLSAPGNKLRLYAETNIALGAFKQILFQNVWTFILILSFEFFLWYFIFRSMYVLSKNDNKNDSIIKDIKFIKALLIMGFGMTAVMFMSPNFPARSSFFGLLYLIIAAGTLLRMQCEHRIIILRESAKKFLLCLSIVFFVITAYFSFRNYYTTHVQVNNIIASFQNLDEEQKNRVFVVEKIRAYSRNARLYTTLHFTGFNISEDELEWKNVAFARYFGIKGIRARSEIETNQ